MEKHEFVKFLSLILTIMGPEQNPINVIKEIIGEHKIDLSKKAEFIRTCKSITENLNDLDSFKYTLIIESFTVTIKKLEIALSLEKDLKIVAPIPNNTLMEVGSELISLINKKECIDSFGMNREDFTHMLSLTLWVMTSPQTSIKEIKYVIETENIDVDKTDDFLKCCEKITENVEDPIDKIRYILLNKSFAIAIKDLKDCLKANEDVHVECPLPMELGKRTASELSNLFDKFY